MLVPTPKRCDISVKKAIQLLATKLDYDSTPTFAGLNLLTGPLDLSGKMTVGSFASPIDVTDVREYGVELHCSGKNYNATAIRARAQAVTTDTSAQFQGGLFQAANNDGINVGCLNGLVAEAIGKSTTTAATITMMRGALIGAEWSAKDTVTDLRTLHVRTHTRDAATEGYVSGTGYGIMIENEAVGGNGQALDAGIYFRGTNLSAGNKAYTYGIDFSGGTFGSEEIKLANGSVIGSDKVTFQPTTDSTTFFQILDADGGIPLFVGDTTGMKIGVGIAIPLGMFHVEKNGAQGEGTSIIRASTNGWNAIAGHFVSSGGGSQHWAIKVEGPSYFADGFTIGDGTGGQGFLQILTDAGEDETSQLLLRAESSTTVLGANVLGDIFFGSNQYSSFYMARIRAIKTSGYAGSAGAKVDLTFSTNEGQTDNLVEHMRIKDNGNTGFNEVAPETLTEWTHATPYLTLHNSTHEDSDGGRESRINFKGEQGITPFEETTLARIEVSHDGTGADDKGKIVFSVNDGNDGDTPTQALEIGSDLLTTFAGNITAVDGTFTGHIALGGTSIDADAGINYNEVLTDTDNSNKYGIYSKLEVAKTASAFTSIAVSVRGDISIDSTNSQSWTFANIPMRGFSTTLTTEAGSGTISGAAGLTIASDIRGGPVLTNLYGVHIFTPSYSAGDITNLYGIYIQDQNVGDTLNYAIYTNAGTVRFGGEILGFAGAKIGDGGTTNYTHIDSGGRLLLEGTAQTWEDLRIVPGAFQFPGTADPTLENWQPGGAGTTFKVYKFKKDDEVHFTCQLPHNYKQGSDIKPHIHWTPCDRGNEEIGNTVGWKIDYSWANTDAAFASSATIDLSHACSGTDDLHELTASGTITGTAKTISGILVIRLYRSDTGDVDDTWVGATAALSPAILEFDLHYEVDSLGSDLELVKDAP